MYFDDSHITDRAVHGPSAQWSFCVLNDLLGTRRSARELQMSVPSWVLTSTSRRSTHMGVRVFGFESDSSRRCSPSCVTPGRVGSSPQVKPRNSTAWYHTPGLFYGRLVPVSYASKAATTLGTSMRKTISSLLGRMLMMASSASKADRRLAPALLEPHTGAPSMPGSCLNRCARIQEVVTSPVLCV